MNRFDGTLARQLDLIEDVNIPAPAGRQPVQAGKTVRIRMQLLRKDVYAELNRRRRRAQIAARHELERS